MWKTPSALVLIVLLLLVGGFVMLTSTSSMKADRSFHDADYFVKRQFAWMVVAICLGFLLSNLDYHQWQRLALPLVLISIVLLSLVFVPGIGVKVGGSRRWIRSGPVGFQPSEMAKLTTVMALAWWMSREQGRVSRLKEGLVLPLVILGAVAGLIFIETDLGTAVLIGAVGMVIMFLGGTRPVPLAVCALVAFLMATIYVLHNPTRMGRILAFLDPEKYEAAAYQLVQAKDAFIMGGPWGVGFGHSLQKCLYLPEAHTDFILPIIGEELGIVATLAITALFAGVLACGLVISLRAPDLFGRLLGLGLTTLLTMQAAINIGVVTGLLPTKGLPLPFISYGGASLLSSLAAVGVLLNIARHSAEEYVDVHTRIIKDRTHWI